MVHPGPQSPSELPPSAPQSTQQAGWVPPTKSSTPTWLRHLHWCLALAMIPLALSVVIPHESTEELTERLLRSLRAANPTLVSTDGPAAAADNPAAKADAPPESETPPAEEDETELADLLEEMSLDDLMSMLPQRKLEGAFLARNSHLHWLFALLSVVTYMTFFVFLASDNSAKSWHLLGLGTFTATVGIVLLLIVQALSMIGFVGGGGIVGLILAVLSLIGLSYSAALDPDIGFFGSFVGFTCGVGLCEELCKALPILVYYRIGNTQNWRGAFLWGLASGTGFGVSEGIMYSGDFYNGICGPGIYVVRFVSCVALHAIWTGSVAISINQRQSLIQEEQEHWPIYVLAVLWMIAIPMVLHGLYDTLLKKDLELLALVVAAASFGYLAWVISRLRHSDDEDERAAYVAQFIRSKAAAGQG
jgi:RsiW-degrading membrane proteinase PrsW (M82 family)